VRARGTAARQRRRTSAPRLPPTLAVQSSARVRSQPPFLPAATRAAAPRARGGRRAQRPRCLAPASGSDARRRPRAGPKSAPGCPRPPARCRLGPHLHGRVDLLHDALGDVLAQPRVVLHQQRHARRVGERGALGLARHVHLPRAAASARGRAPPWSPPTGRPPRPHARPAGSSARGRASRAQPPRALARRVRRHAAARCCTNKLAGSARRNSRAPRADVPG
jgi:hypothetical protein